MPELTPKGLVEAGRRVEAKGADAAHVTIRRNATPQKARAAVLQCTDPQQDADALPCA